MLPPPNVPAQIVLDQSHRRIEIIYNESTIFKGFYSGASKVDVFVGGDSSKVLQTIVFHGRHVELSGKAKLSTDSFAAETEGPQQARFPLVRNSDGPSFNLRNNAIYDRARDAALIGPPDGETKITPRGNGGYEFEAKGDELKLQFKPRFYQQHKNIAFFRPWQGPLKTRPIMGWCSWWAYQNDIDAKTLEAAADVFARNLKPFGYDIIQLDDGYESAAGAPPGFWLNTNQKFPEGISGIAERIRRKGMEPGIWVGTQIFDDEVTKAHREWFVRNADGTVHKGPWIGYGIDASKPDGLKALYQPVWDSFKKAGFTYVKIDSLRHLLYDSLYPCRKQMLAEHVTPEEAFRDYLSFARQRLGAQTYILACWGVLPEATGIADGCRLGGDGFGPDTLQQYNSWNNVVWRNDPDHVDLKGPGDDVLRPTLVSMAGGQLLLSDKVDFYEDPAHLEGAKRASPVPYTMPGQLYDYDPSKTDNLVKGLRNQNGGSEAGPIDASKGNVQCPWWQLDVARPFECWTVLARLSTKSQPEQQVSFADLGLPAAKYSVYEFWSKRYLGEFEGSFPAEAQRAKDAHVYCIRKLRPHPQVISTSRHITQGGPDLLKTSWEGHTLRGESLLTKGDLYQIRIRAAGLKAEGASSAFVQDGDLVIIDFKAGRSMKQAWWVRFR